MIFPIPLDLHGWFPDACFGCDLLGHGNCIQSQNVSVWRASKIFPKRNHKATLFWDGDDPTKEITPSDSKSYQGISMESAAHRYLSFFGGQPNRLKITFEGVKKFVDGL